ncbi:hypothetical protein AB685_01520 [Bacillus sp. LL01]|uniref:tetratricopeptide repeat protein n=1 Tax=Bacillus sp. LL01 TaxID=1665556 RepID=UPI00064D4D37|nr:hypothetical protein [Bacillus sp. LL01]KMJ59582.1 hypothetical protein AB685_01520 [Bacillus sp. LL01]
MNTNKKAIELLESNEYEEALKLFQTAVNECRNVQSLTNLAWIYCYEEYKDEKAIVLLEEAIKFKPNSHFPYSLLGEIYIRQEKWELAKDVLESSISIQPSKTTYNNLAIANYHIGNIEMASRYFLLATEKSDYAMYSHVICLIELGKLNEAKDRLDTFSEHDDEFVGEVDVADMYVELGYFKKANEWFNKGWDVYWKQPNWVSRYVYSLLKLNNKSLANEIINDVIKEKIKEIDKAQKDDCDEDWSEEDKINHLEKLRNEKKEYEGMFEKISSGYFPPLVFEVSMKTGCYLFGCIRHNHPEYQE